MKYVIAGASVKGAGHKKTKMSNQDSVFFVNNKNFDLAVVADGVGSDRHSHIGSKKICKAVNKTFKLLAFGKIAEKDVRDTIIKIFQKNITKKVSSACSTTCLFFVALSNGDVFLAQAGDGLCAYILNGKYGCINNDNSNFSNQVKAIKGNACFSDWKTIKIPASKIETLSVLLATDGISEDILPEKQMDFITHLTANCLYSKQKKSNATIKNVLNNWGTPNSIDDKTIIIAERCENV